MILSVKFKAVVLGGILITGSLQAQEKGGSGKFVVIKGQMNGDTKGYNKVYIYGNNVKQDSAVMINGAFTFTLPYDKPFSPLFYTEYDKVVKRMYSPYPVLIDRPSVVMLKDGDITKGLASAKVSGIKSAEEFNIFRERQADMYKKINEQLAAKYKQELVPAMKSTASNPGNAARNKEREELTKEATVALLEDFVKQYPDSYASALALSNYGRTGLTIENLERIYAMLSTRNQQSEEGKVVAGYIAGVKSSSIGSIVKDFTLNTPEETPLSFSQLKGKYVLIDFWASWCGPCKASFPHMKEVYKKYKSDKFEIYSISIDKDKDAWLKGLKEQQLPWLQTLDTKNISQSGFAVTGVPTTYLIDPQGKILMKEVGFDASGNSPLEKKLIELFGDKGLTGAAEEKKKEGAVKSMPMMKMQ